MLRKLEKYELIEEIGHGGMATVYRARDTVLDRPVALKIMHPHLRGAEEARRRFWREARSVARLRHPRVLEIYDFSGEGSDEAYIAAELLTGPTLKAYRESQAEMPAEIAACFAIEIANALEAAHAAGIVHRDVKPENVLLHDARTIKLTDFGIADMVDSQSMTATGQILGSPGHMAPEQIEGKDCDARTDLFSLGTVLYYLATGRLPFTGRNPHQVLKRIMDGEYADPLRVNPTIGGRLREIIVKALAREPSERYQTAGELRGDLTAFVAEVGIESPEQTLERFLKDPEAVRKELRERAIPKLIELGSRASDAGDVPKALDYYNRVLALDEGNESVLRLIERVGQDRRRRAIFASAGLLAAFGLVAAGGAWMLWPTGPGGTTAGPDAGLAISTSADAADGGDAGFDAGSDAGHDAGSDAGVDAGQDEAPAVVSSAARRILFSVRPAAVSIAIDGGEPQPLGPSFPITELRPGRHTFRVTPLGELESQFRAETFTENVPPGSGEHRLSFELGYSPAGLHVRSNVAGEVRIDGRVRRTNMLFDVPMSAQTQTHNFTVSAPGYRTASGSVLLTAGQSAEARLDLEPEAPEAP